MMDDIVYVDIGISSETLEPNAYQTVCFITENEEIIGDVKVESLYDFPNNGYRLSSKAYNFTRSVIDQGYGVNVIIRSKLPDESYIDAYLRGEMSGENTGFYYVVLDTKDIATILSFNDTIQEKPHLQFFSSMRKFSDLGERRLAYFYVDEYYEYLRYDSNLKVETDDGEFLISEKHYEIDNDIGYILADDSQELVLDEDDLFLELDINNDRTSANEGSYFYPEGAWVGRCAYSFPTRIQWIYKTLKNVLVNNDKSFPEISNYYSNYRGYDVVLGNSKLCNGDYIHHTVSLDWLAQSISSNVWNLLYTLEVLNFTENSYELVVSRVEDVLSFMVDEEFLESYSIGKVIPNKNNNSISLRFEMVLNQPILKVKKIVGRLTH